MNGASFWDGFGAGMLGGDIGAVMGGAKAAAGYGAGESGMLGAPGRVLLVTMDMVEVPLQIGKGREIILQNQFLMKMVSFPMTMAHLLGASRNGMQEQIIPEVA